MCLLICVSGLESDTWYLVLVGGLGRVQNLFWPHEEEEDIMEEDELTTADKSLINERPGPIETVGTRGAIRELEKTIPGAGFAITPIFFPALSRVDEERFRDAKEVRFWRLMLKRRKKTKTRYAVIIAVEHDNNNSALGRIEKHNAAIATLPIEEYGTTSEMLYRHVNNPCFSGAEPLY
ncbi:hypothetical protein EDB80DRAFT_679685 [Ilyonectria destructans]|nr:hypothetical protein EDB80DRAFT_679685 [Ilyonectria destructans]